MIDTSATARYTVCKLHDQRSVIDHRLASSLSGKIALIEPTLTYDSFSDVDIVIEAVPEKMKIKKWCWPSSTRRRSKLDFTCLALSDERGKCQARLRKIYPNEALGARE